MPAWVTPVVALVSIVFSAGITWGVLSYRQKYSETTQGSLIKDLKDCVTKLQTLVTEVEVMKVANARFERQSEEHDRRLGDLEVTVAKHITTTRRKR